jgi:hypothetical protein
VPLLVHIKLLACVYALNWAVAAAQSCYEIVFAEARSTTLGPFTAVVGLVLAYGLVTFRPWARILGLLLSGLMGLVAVVSSLFYLWHFLDIQRAAGRVIVEGTFLPLINLVLYTAFAAWQWWVLTHPQVRLLFSSKPA